MSQEVLYHRDGAVAVLTLNRPEKLNAFTLGMGDALVAATKRAAGDREARVIVVTGAGRAFCAGGDVGYMGALVAKQDQAAFDALVSCGDELIATFRSAGKPVIAAVNGVAAGGGMSLALACDLRIAGASASFSQAFVRVGMHPDWGSSFFLPRIVGVSRALELALSGRSVKSEEALTMGLVHRVVPDDSLRSEAMTWAQRLVSLPPLALASIRETYATAFERDLDATLRHEAAVQSRLFASSDAKEGMAAFQEKRKPSFTGE